MQHCAQRATDRVGLEDYTHELAQVLHSVVGLNNVCVLLINPTSHQLQQYFITDLELNAKSKKHNSKAALIELFNGEIGSWMLTNDSDCIVKDPQHFFTKQLLIKNYQDINLPEQLIGCLLKVDNQAVGVLVVKSYQTFTHFDQQLSLLQRVGYLLSTKIAADKRETELQAFKDFQRRDLQARLQQSAKAEKLQRALYKVAALSTEYLSIEEFYKKIHAILDTLIDATNIGIVSYDEESEKFSYGYVRSCKNDDYREDKELPLGPGFSSYIVRERIAILLTPKIVEEMVAQGKITELLGNQDYCYWMGAPLIFDGAIYGTITLQSYDEEIVYTQSDLQLLQFLANHVARALAIHCKQLLQEQEQQRLIMQQGLLEEQNAQINQTLTDLHLTEQALIKREKINSLGELVGDVAVQLTEPLKKCRTIISNLSESNREFQQCYLNESLSEEFLEENLRSTLATEHELAENMKTAASLINRLKQISVEENDSEISKINLLEYLNRLFLNLKAGLKASNVIIQLECDQQIAITTNARALSKVLKYLVDNSICHAFSGQQHKLIQIIFSLENNQVMLHYSDNGIGMSKQALKKLFTPFYSTSHTPGSGLGSSCVYNLVNSSLHGTVSVKSPTNSGVYYQIAFPNLSALKKAEVWGVSDE